MSIETYCERDVALIQAVVRAITERKLVTLRVIDSIDPIPEADAIEVATIGGWKLVVKKGEFAVGDPCLYFEIDSFLPDGNPAWQFLVDKSSRTFNGVLGHRLRTVKLRGQVSQGLALPLHLFPEVLATAANDTATVGEVIEMGGIENLREMRFEEVLNVVKWDPPLPAELAGQAEGLFPSFIRKTDQERCQNLVGEIFGYEDQLVPFNETTVPSEVLHELETKGVVRAVEVDGAYPVFMKVLPAKADRNAQYEVTIKLDGSSATYFHRDGKVGACSRNLELKVDGDANGENTFVRMLKDSGLEGALAQLGNIAIQGELMGPGIQGNREQLKDFQFFLFDAQNLDTQTYLTPQERYSLMDKLYALGVDSAKVKHVPVLFGTKFMQPGISSLGLTYGHLLQDLGLTNVAELLKFAEGPSLVHAIREGLVFKKLDGTFSFKAISNLFLAKEKD